MLSYEQLDFALNTIGTIAFAFSGAMVGIKKGMDLLGVIVLGVVTALGGGCVRDLVLGINPPNMFTDSFFARLSVISCIIIFTFFYIRTDYLKSKKFKKYEDFMLILDAIGLGAFTVTGINTALLMGFSEDKFLLIFVGMVTGVGGGVIRDIFSREIPFVFVEQIYAVASFLGAMFYIKTMNILSHDTVMIISALIVLITRIIAVNYNINLPKISKEKL